MKKQQDIYVCDIENCGYWFTELMSEKTFLSGSADNIGSYPQGLWGVECKYCQVHLCKGHAHRLEFLTQENHTTKERVFGPLCTGCFETLQKFIDGDDLMQVFDLVLQKKKPSVTTVTKTLDPDADIALLLKHVQIQ